MLKPWLKRILQIVATLALVVLVVIVYRRTDWCKGFTPDGIMTLIAGVLAFAAVQWQMWDQRSRQKRAVASAILFEIDATYRYLLREVSKWLKLIDPESVDLRSVAIKSFVARFPILDANAGKIGDLGERTVPSVVRF
jgi:hypothetical protein